MKGPENRSNKARQRLEPARVAGRVPPHDLDAEACVLSAIMLDPNALDRVVEFLRAEHFYSHPNQRIYEAALELAMAGVRIDIASVASWLRDRERLTQVGGPSYLAQLSDATPAVAHVADHARVVYAKWRVRQLIATCQRLAAEGYGDVGVVQEYIDGAEQAIYELAHGAGTKREGGSLGHFLKQAFQQITAAAERGDRITGISTGYEKLDAKTAGLHEGDLTIVAARPGMGKSALAMNLATNVAAPRHVQVQDDRGQTVGAMQSIYGALIVTIEMPGEQLATRTIATEGRVDLGRIRQGFLQPDDWRRLTEAGALLSDIPIWIEPASAPTVLDVRAMVRRFQAEFNRAATATSAERKVGLVVIDYLQLMKGRDGVNSREQEIAEISRGLKQLAKELKVPVIALSQLNRAVETRSTKDKRPQLSDLRESGAIEQDADTIIFIYRDEYYNPETTNARGIAELIIAKQRNGPTGKVLTRFNASCTRFDNLAAGDYPEAMEDQ